MNNRQNDVRGEKALGLFLDHYYYPRLCEIEGFKGTKRIFDVKEQKLGADLIIIGANDETRVIDEKAQLHYINKPRGTFAFEVSYYNDEIRGISDGWFISSTNKTDYYNLVWITEARTNQLNRIVEEDFNEIVVALVSKNRMIHYLEQLGYPIKRIRKISRDMRFNRNGNHFKLSEDAFIYYTREGYEEKPINVVVNNKVISKLAFGVYKVDREGVSKVKMMSSVK